jgi:hypothetical protein
VIGLRINYPGLSADNLYLLVVHSVVVVGARSLEAGIWAQHTKHRIGNNNVIHSSARQHSPFPYLSLFTSPFVSPPRLPRLPLLPRLPRLPRLLSNKQLRACVTRSLRQSRDPY